jgi:CheY-like chemotaxis protein
MTDERPKLLLVDDDDDFVLQQRIQLEQHGFTVVSAASRAEAERMLEQTQPSLAIVDLMMEEMDAGFVLAHHVKQRYPSTPVILVTAVTSETGLEFAAPAPGERSWIKADAVLAKPVRFEQLLREIGRLIG